MQFADPIRKRFLIKRPILTVVIVHPGLKGCGRSKAEAPRNGLGKMARTHVLLASERPLQRFEIRMTQIENAHCRYLSKWSKFADYASTSVEDRQEVLDLSARFDPATGPARRPVKLL